MRLSTRGRFIVALVISWPVGLLYLSWVGYNGRRIVEESRGGFAGCSGDWRSSLNGCTSFSPTLAWIEIAVFTVAALTVLVVLARWVFAPLQRMADTITQLGPTSLGLRIRAQGPRDEARRAADAIDAMLDRVAEGYDAQRRFAANASHELRTPLATQRALIEVSLQSALTPEQLQLLSRQLLATNERNEALIEGLLVLAETERGLLTTGPQQLDAVLAAVVHTMQPAAAERGIRIDTVLEPVAVMGELPLLERLATNLVQNAVKYNIADGWVQVEVRAPAVLRVSNSGPPVAAEQVTGLFEPFRRAGSDRLDHSGGAGLGLTIARSVVAAHSGSIGASANRDGGLTVEVHFPV